MGVVAAKCMERPNTSSEPLITNYLCNWQVYVSHKEIGMSHWKLRWGSLYTLPLRHCPAILPLAGYIDSKIVNSKLLGFLGLYDLMLREITLKIRDQVLVGR